MDLAPPRPYRNSMIAYEMANGIVRAADRITWSAATCMSHGATPAANTDNSLCCDS